MELYHRSVANAAQQPVRGIKGRREHLVRAAVTFGLMLSRLALSNNYGPSVLGEAHSVDDHKRD
jgi:hypothetical protein